ncbi:MAG: aminotransferase class I/II-fold pyridoxal phosphate-dependent enzyme [Verrucomicrobiota bacterium]
MELFGTSYLQLQKHPEYLEILTDNLRQHGVNNPISRNNLGHFEILESVETELAKMWHCESACLLANGFLAGQAIRMLANRLPHPSYVQSDGHPCYHGSVSACSRSPDDSEPFSVILDAVDPFSGQAKWSCSESLETLSKARVFAMDISHVFNVWTPSAIFERLGLACDGRAVFFGSLAKAAAFPAGFVAGPRSIIEEIRKFPIYTASSAPARYLAASYLDSDDLRSHLRDTLNQVMIQVFEGLGLECDALSFPVCLIRSSPEISLQFFERKGMQISALSYPTPDAPVRIRCVLNAGLTFSDIETLIETLDDLIDRNPNPTAIEWAKTTSQKIA